MDLSTSYLGLKLRSPLVPSACQPLTGKLDNIKKMEDAGAGAVVLHSLFEEQFREESVELARHTTENTDSFSEAASFFPEPEEYLLEPEEYLQHIQKAKQAVKIPIIASLNGTTTGGWTDFAKKVEQAGADALELNIYRVLTDGSITSSKIEDENVQILKSVKAKVKIPVAVKLSPYFTNFVNMAKRLDEAGANGLVCFNRFYQPDIDIEELKVRPDVILSSPLVLRTPLRWIAILNGRLKADLAGTGGVHKAEDAIKLLMAGAKVAMMCSALLRYGIDFMRSVNDRLKEWMEEHGYDSVKTMQGSMSQIKCEDPVAFERAQYLKTVHSYMPKRDH